jgi:hypothetical protein
MDGEWVMVSKDIIVAYFKTISRHPLLDKEHSQNIAIRIAGNRPIFEPVIS